jgi:hypothetical protein
MMHGKECNCSKSICYTIPTTLSQMIVEGNQCASSSGYMTTEPPNTKSDQPTLGYEDFASIKPLDEESKLLRRTFQL